MKPGIWASVTIGLIGSALTAQEVTISAPGAEDGLTDFLATASLSQGLADAEDPAPQDYVAAARADYRTLLTALYTKGYYSGEISIRVDGREASSIAPLDAPARINRVEIVVSPGPQFTFGTADIAPLPAGTTPPQTYATGEVAVSDAVRQAAVAGVEGWRDAGHAKADVGGQRITARHADAQLDASVTLTPGPVLTFGPLTVTGNENVRTGAIENIAGLPTGDQYSPDELRRVAARLRDTGAFDSVALTEAEAIGPGNTLPIGLAVVEAKPRRFGAGVELSSVEGLKISSYWLHRNAFGAAERFRVEGEIAGIGGGTGGVDYSIDTSLTVPAIYGPDLDLIASAGISREDEPDYLLDKAEVEVGLSRQFTDSFSATGGVGLLRAREETDSGVREYTLLTLPLSATYDKRDDPANAQNGYYIDVEATPFYGLDGSDSGGRVYADARGYLSFGADDRITIAGRGQIGSIIGADIDATPADYLFYSGGSGTVRGQSYKSLGITETIDGEDTTTGGLSFVGAQLEARYGVTDSIGVVGFYDVGYVGASQTPGTDGDWQSGVGIGARYNTGIGPIRLDIGTPAHGDDAFGSVEVYIGIGQAF